jgi:Na+/H+-dicarboxylate symporter
VILILITAQLFLPLSILFVSLTIIPSLPNLFQGVIITTPYAVLSLVAGALAQQDNLSTAFKDIGLLIGGAVTAFVLHTVIFYPLLLLFFRRKNPFSYLKFLIPAQSMAFASSSSAVTLPVTMKCVERTEEVPANIRNFES